MTCGAMTLRHWMLLVEHITRVLLYVTFHPYVEFVYMYKHPELKSNVSLYVCAVQ